MSDLTTVVGTGPHRLTYEDGRLVAVEVWTSTDPETGLYFCANFRDPAAPRLTLQGTGR